MRTLSLIVLGTLFLIAPASAKIDITSPAPSWDSETSVEGGAHIRRLYCASSECPTGASVFFSNVPQPSCDCAPNYWEAGLVESLSDKYTKLSVRKSFKRNDVFDGYVVIGELLKRNIATNNRYVVLVHPVLRENEIGILMMDCPAEKVVECRLTFTRIVESIKLSQGPAVARTFSLAARRPVAAGVA